MVPYPYVFIDLLKTYCLIQDAFTEFCPMRRIIKVQVTNLFENLENTGYF